MKFKSRLVMFLIMLTFVVGYMGMAVASNKPTQKLETIASLNLNHTCADHDDDAAPTQHKNHIKISAHLCCVSHCCTVVTTPMRQDVALNIVVQSRVVMPLPWSHKLFSNEIFRPPRLV